MTDDRRTLMHAASEQSLETALTLAECQEQLDRIARAGALVADSRGYALLAYLLDHYQKAGPRTPVKAYAIAVDVLGRPSSFDPTRDSIVRVEVSRLRKLLELYFLGPGASDPVRFSIPGGQSHLVLRRHLTEAEVPPPVEPEPVRKFPWQSPAIALGAAILCVALITGFAALRGGTGTAEVDAALAEEFPRLFVQPFKKLEMVAEAFPRGALSAFLAAELSEFKTFRVIGPSSPSTLPVRARDFILEGTVLRADRTKNALVDLRLTLKDKFGTILWSDTLRFDPQDWGGPGPVFQAISGISSTLGGAMGVIDTIGRDRLDAELTEWSDGTPPEFHCILLWQSFDLLKDPDDRSGARRCLEAAAANKSRVSQVWSALGFSRLLDWIETGAHLNAPEVQGALAAANRAVLLDPEGADGHESLGSILTALGRLPEARTALERARQQNPSNLDTIVKLGWLDCLEGDWGTGRDRIQSVLTRFTVVPGWYRIPLALAAFLDGDPAEMLRQSKAMVASGDHRGVALATIAAGLLGDDREVDLHLSTLQAKGKSLSQSLMEVEAIFPDKDLMARLQATAE